MMSPGGFVPPPPPGMFPPGMPGFFSPPRQHGFTRAIFVTLASTIFGLSLLANMYLLLYSGLFSAQANLVSEQTVVDGDPKEKVAIIPVHGIIRGETVMVVGRWLRAAGEDANVKAIVLEVDTPGGDVTSSDEIHHLIDKLRKAKTEHGGTFPIAVSMGGLGTSGGYYVSAGADQIFAQPTTLTGNIGVMMPRFNISGLVEKWGVAEKTLAAPEGGYKNAGSMFSPDNPRDAKYLQGIVDQAYDQFKGVVKTGREGKLKASLAEVANGQVFTAQQALKNGLVDQIDYLEAAYKWAATQAGLSKPTVVRYHRRATLLETFLAESSDVGPRKVNVNVQVDRSAIDEVMTPRLQYLWRGE